MEEQGTGGGRGEEILYNLHVHSTFSDGLITPEEVVKAAASGGLKGVGFAEHYRSTKLPADKSLGPANIPEYAKVLKRLGREFGGEPKVLAGIEIPFVLLASDFSSLGLASYDEGPMRHLDYVLFEYVSDPLWEGMDLFELLKIRPMISIPVGLAHCDVDQVFSPRLPSDDLAAILATHRIFVELCPSPRNSRPGGKEREDESKGREFTPYYRVDSDYMRGFFQAARELGVLFSIGSDAHNSPEEVCDIDDAVAFIREQELQGQLLTFD